VVTEVLENAGGGAATGCAYNLETLSYQVEPGDRVPAYLLVPAGTAREGEVTLVILDSPRLPSIGFIYNKNDRQRYRARNYRATSTLV
jgi:hypothetical protein